MLKWLRAQNAGEGATGKGRKGDGRVESGRGGLDGAARTMGEAVAKNWGVNGGGAEVFRRGRIARLSDGRLSHTDVGGDRVWRRFVGELDSKQVQMAVRFAGAVRSRQGHNGTKAEVPSAAMDVSGTTGRMGVRD